MKNLKGRCGKLKMQVKMYENEHKTRPFFSHFKPLKCLGSTKIENVYREKRILPPGENREKWLCPLSKIFLLRSWALETVDSMEYKRKPDGMLLFALRKQIKAT